MMTALLGQWWCGELVDRIRERESIQEEVVGADKKYRVQPGLEPSTFRTAKAGTVRVEWLKM